MTYDKSKSLSASALAKLSQLEAANAEYRQMVLTAKAEAERQALALTAKSKAKRDNLVLEAWLLMGGEGATTDRTKRQHGLSAKLIKDAAGISQHRDYQEIISDADWTSPEITVDWTLIEPYLTKPWTAKFSGHDLYSYKVRVTHFYQWATPMDFEVYPMISKPVDIFTRDADNAEVQFRDWDGLDTALPDVPDDRRTEILTAFYADVTAQYKARGHSEPAPA
jgi:hypothetical protein